MLAVPGVAAAGREASGRSVFLRSLALLLLVAWGVPPTLTLAAALHLLRHHTPGEEAGTGPAGGWALAAAHGHAHPEASPDHEHLAVAPGRSLDRQPAPAGSDPTSTVLAPAWMRIARGSEALPPEIRWRRGPPLLLPSPVLLL